jgi:predicted transcriptional regulator
MLIREHGGIAIADLIVMGRAATGRNQVTIARAAGIPVTRYCRIERGLIDPRDGELVAILRALSTAEIQVVRAAYPIGDAP